MYRSNAGISFFAIAHWAPISKISPIEKNKLVDTTPYTNKLLWESNFKHLPERQKY